MLVKVYNYVGHLLEMKIAEMHRNIDVKLITAPYYDVKMALGNKGLAITQFFNVRDCDIEVIGESVNENN